MACNNAVIPNNMMPVFSECMAAELPIWGQLPKTLNGTLFRNGPNPQFPAASRHWFDGDGMVHAFSLAEGRASYRNVWVRTAKWKAERQAGRSLIEGLAAVSSDLNKNFADEGVANTNVVWHAGRLLALEEGHLPIELIPKNLATRGVQDFGALRGPFTAHPKTDPITGELVFFGYSVDGDLTSGMHYGTIDVAGRGRIPALVPK
jgi:carotenoid cleavage dioxygenase-like enzyme